MLSDTEWETLFDSFAIHEPDLKESFKKILTAVDFTGQSDVQDLLQILDLDCCRKSPIYFFSRLHGIFITSQLAAVQRERA